MRKLLEKLVGRHNERGEEVLDPTPVEVPLYLRRPESLQEKMRRMIAVELSMHAQQQGFESFEEADDFDVDDDPQPGSPHELTPMQEEFRLDASDLERPKEGPAAPVAPPKGEEATPPAPPLAEQAARPSEAKP